MLPSPPGEGGSAPPRCDERPVGRYAVADNANVPSIVAAKVPVACVFTNGKTIVRFDEVDEGAVFYLVISGAGVERETREFAQPHARIAYQQRCEARLRRQGYILAAVIYQSRRRRCARSATLESMARVR